MGCVLVNPHAHPALPFAYQIAMVKLADISQLAKIFRSIPFSIAITEEKAHLIGERLMIVDGFNGWLLE